ncbi:transketolase family protein [Actinobacillus porcinus]|uniref:transketolase family protein n=1 Tax=Actinobacillus porcinus TaxID=51048 RepID=UPI0023F09213|nr:transketolase family protein [Actinobacillus porcinus]MDD7544241.1 transketolase family protein [Actinobacillus porcinus]MDY5847349.1 transketolase family protein [Actinobacillus porcinus]MDY6216282.1 transketolase family protein [Actinobacillus porcinus]
MTKKKLTTSAMIASIAEEGQETISAPFGEALVKLAQTRQDIVGVTADLAKYTDLHIFAQKYPERFFQVGIAEQLAMATAGGLAKTGLTPFVTTYAVFATRRAYEFIHQIIAEENLNVKIAVALPGLTTGYGPSHQATEDIAMMRGIPNLTIIDPCDACEIEQIVPAIADHKGPVYLRLLRGKVPAILKDYNYQFEIGKAKLLEDGNDVLMISTGILTMRALETAKKLREEGINVAVLHCPTIKPLDTETILSEVTKSNRLVIVAENHSEVGGLGESIACLLMKEQITTRFKQIALPDQFLHAGALPTLHDNYGISTTAICNSIKTWLE